SGQGGRCRHSLAQLQRRPAIRKNLLTLFSRNVALRWAARFWTAATESAESPLWSALCANYRIRFQTASGQMQSKAVTPQAPSPQSKTPSRLTQSSSNSGTDFATPASGVHGPNAFRKEMKFQEFCACRRTVHRESGLCHFSGSTPQAVTVGAIDDQAA